MTAPTIYHSGGDIMMSGRVFPLTLAEARALHDDIKHDAQVCIHAARIPEHYAATREVIAILSWQEQSLRGAIEACELWRKASGWSDPAAADRVRG